MAFVARPLCAGSGRNPSRPPSEGVSVLFRLSPHVAYCGRRQFLGGGGRSQRLPGYVASPGAPDNTVDWAVEGWTGSYAPAREPIAAGVERLGYSCTSAPRRRTRRDHRDEYRNPQRIDDATRSHHSDGRAVPRARIGARHQEARVFGDVKFALELADGAKVDIAVESVFSEKTARAKARVILDGSPIFDESWYSPDSETLVELTTS